jgi:hypothetical protein
MALWGTTHIKQTNARGDVFYSYGSLASPSPIIYNESALDPCSPPNKSDNNDTGNVSNGEDEDLSGQFAGINLGDANVATREHRPRRRTEQTRGATRTNLNTQWEIDNLPIQGTPWATPNEEPIEGTGERVPDAGGLSDEHVALIALERAYQDLQLPIMDDGDGETQHNMVQVAVHFIFRALPCLDHIRKDMATFAHVYDAHALAEQFYIEYGVAIWGFGAGGGGNVDDQRMVRLETFFNALRAQDSTRSEAEEIEDKPLKQLVHLRRVTADASRALPSGVQPDASLAELYSALEIQTADNWVNNEFQRAVAQMMFQALSRVRDTVDSFPCSRPSGVLLEGVIERIMGRYARCLWPNSNARPNDVMLILHQYILVLLRTKMTRGEVGEDAIQRLDGFLGLEDGDAEEERSHVQDENREHGDLECTLAHMAEYESCSHSFQSAADLAAHLVKVHDWDQHLADEIAYDR